MSDIFSRSELLLGSDAIERLSHSRVAVFGVGGVGGYAVEALARCGVGTLDLIDNDTISESNINRQIIATGKTVGLYKVDVAAERCTDINPHIKVNTYKVFYMPETANMFDFSKYDYIVDAIDTVTGKIEIIVNAYKTNTPVISSMGTGNKLDPSAFEVSDIYNTSVCPLARVMRYELKKRNIPSLKVVYSKEKPISPAINNNPEVQEALSKGRHIPASCSFVPPIAGMIIAGEVIKDIIS